VKSNQQEHESTCELPKKNGADLMTAVVANLDQLKEQMLQQKLLIQMLSCERISICDIQLLASRTDDFIPKLYYESNRFSAFDQTWMLKAKVQGDERSIDRKFSYQLICKNKCNMEMKYFAVKGPFGDMEVTPELQRYEFMDDKRESDYHPVTLNRSSDCNRLLSAKNINLRLIMFLIGK